MAMGCRASIAMEVAEHLIDADLCGVYSHGIFRLVPYAEEALKRSYMPGASPTLTTADGGAILVDGGNGLGVSAFRMAIDHAVDQAKVRGVSAIGVVNVDHTGRIGAYAQRAADAGCLAIIFGGGSRRDWRQVAPYGGARGMLPTNPYALAIPGGKRGPVVIDFATSSAAGGKVYAAHHAGRQLAEGLCIDSEGRPTTNPADYMNGGALLPMGGPKGYGMALIAELLGEAIMGDAKNGMHWICVCIDLARYRDASTYRAAAEECLQELRDCPPAPGFERVEIPGEREAAQRADRLSAGVPIPPATLAAIKAMAATLGLAPDLIEALGARG